MATLQSGFCSVARCLLNYKSAWTFHHREIFEYAHLKFTVSGRSKPTSIHTRVRNAVTLVWGLLRLAPMRQRVVRVVRVKVMVKVRVVRVVRSPLLNFGVHYA